jgi:Flp pilus assembly protein TadD
MPSLYCSCIHFVDLTLAVCVQVEKATEALQKLLARDGAHFEALNNYACICVQNGAYEAAIRLLERALSLNEHSPLVWSNLALAYDL